MRFAVYAVLSASWLARVGVAGAEPIDIDVFIERARDKDIVILGEVHDNPEHHANQAAIVAALQPGALVFEMFPQSREADVNGLRAEDASRSELADALEWTASGWPSFDYYAPILEAAPDALVFGAEQPREAVMNAAEIGAAGAFGADAAVYGLDVALDPPDQAEREALQAAAHCDALPAEMLPGMVEAQRFRDAKLANAALWARTTSGGQVVVITGSGHADRRRGVPVALAAAAPDVSVITLGQLEAPPDDPDAFDAYMISAPPDREDPCLAFAAPAE